MCFSSCDRTFGSLELQREPEGASHLVSVKLGILSSVERPPRIALELVQESRASSRFEVGNSGFIFISDLDLRVPMEITWRSQPSSRVEERNSTSLLRCKRGVRRPV